MSGRGRGRPALAGGGGGGRSSAGLGRAAANKQLESSGRGTGSRSPAGGGLGRGSNRGASRSENSSPVAGGGRGRGSGTTSTGRGGPSRGGSPIGVGRGGGGAATSGARGKFSRQNSTGSQVGTPSPRGGGRSRGTAGNVPSPLVTSSTPDNQMSQKVSSTTAESRQQTTVHGNSPDFIGVTKRSRKRPKVSENPEAPEVVDIMEDTSSSGSGDHAGGRTHRGKAALAAVATSNGVANGSLDDRAGGQDEASSPKSLKQQVNGVTESNGLSQHETGSDDKKSMADAVEYPLDTFPLTLTDSKSIDTAASLSSGSSGPAVSSADVLAIDGNTSGIHKDDSHAKDSTEKSKKTLPSSVVGGAKESPTPEVAAQVSRQLSKILRDSTLSTSSTPGDTAGIKSLLFKTVVEICRDHQQRGRLRASSSSALTDTKPPADVDKLLDEAIGQLLERRKRLAENGNHTTESKCDKNTELNFISYTTIHGILGALQVYDANVGGSDMAGATPNSLSSQATAAAGANDAPMTTTTEPSVIHSYVSSDITTLDKLEEGMVPVDSIHLEIQDSSSIGAFNLDQVPVVLDQAPQKLDLDKEKLLSSMNEMFNKTTQKVMKGKKSHKKKKETKKENAVISKKEEDVGKTSDSTSGSTSEEDSASGKVTLANNVCDKQVDLVNTAVIVMDTGNVAATAGSLPTAEAKVGGEETAAANLDEAHDVEATESSSAKGTNGSNDFVTMVTSEEAAEEAAVGQMSGSSGASKPEDNGPLKEDASDKATVELMQIDDTQSSSEKLKVDDQVSDEILASKNISNSTDLSDMTEPSAPLAEEHSGRASASDNAAQPSAVTPSQTLEADLGTEPQAKSVPAAPTEAGERMEVDEDQVLVDSVSKAETASPSAEKEKTAAAAAASHEDEEEIDDDEEKALVINVSEACPPATPVKVVGGEESKQRLLSVSQESVGSAEEGDPTSGSSPPSAELTKSLRKVRLARTKPTPNGRTGGDAATPKSVAAQTGAACNSQQLVVNRVGGGTEVFDFTDDEDIPLSDFEALNGIVSPNGTAALLLQQQQQNQMAQEAASVAPTQGIMVNTSSHSSGENSNQLLDPSRALLQIAIPHNNGGSLVRDSLKRCDLSPTILSKGDAVAAVQAVFGNEAEEGTSASSTSKSTSLATTTTTTSDGPPLTVSLKLNGEFISDADTDGQQPGPSGVAMASGSGTSSRDGRATSVRAKKRRRGKLQESDGGETEDDYEPSGSGPSNSSQRKEVTRPKRAKTHHDHSGAGPSSAGGRPASAGSGTYSTRGNGDAAAAANNEPGSCADGQASPDSQPDGQPSARPLMTVVPEKASSFNIHPGRTCLDCCTYCLLRFGMLDTPMHVAQLKTAEKREFASKYTGFSRDACLCDRCFRFLDRRAASGDMTGAKNYPQNGESAPSRQPVRRSPKSCISRTCCQIGYRSFTKKYITRIRKKLYKADKDARASENPEDDIATIMYTYFNEKVNIDWSRVSKVHGKASVWLCKKHYNIISIFTNCGLCHRKLSFNNMCPLGMLREEVSWDAEQINAILRTDSIESNLEEYSFVCRWCKTFLGIKEKSVDPEYLKMHRNHRAFYHDYRKRLQLITNSQPEPDEDDEDQWSDVEDEEEKNVKKTFKVSQSSDNDCKITISAHTPKRNGRTVGASSSDAVHMNGTTRRRTKGTTGKGKEAAASPSEAKIHVSTRTSWDAIPRQAANGHDIPPEVAEKYEIYKILIQFDSSTRKLWQDMHYPYGTYTSFLRHLILLEKYWRNGDLTLAPEANFKSASYLSSVKNRIEAYEKMSSTTGRRGRPSAAARNKELMAADLSAKTRPDLNIPAAPVLRHIPGEAVFESLEDAAVEDTKLAAAAAQMVADDESAELGSQVPHAPSGLNITPVVAASVTSSAAIAPASSSTIGSTILKIPRVIPTSAVATSDISSILSPESLELTRDANNRVLQQQMATANGITSSVSSGLTITAASSSSSSSSNLATTPGKIRVRQDLIQHLGLVAKPGRNSILNSSSSSTVVQQLSHSGNNSSGAIPVISLDDTSPSPPPVSATSSIQIGSRLMAQLVSGTQPDKGGMSAQPALTITGGNISGSSLSSGSNSKGAITSATGPTIIVGGSGNQMATFSGTPQLARLLSENSSSGSGGLEIVSSTKVTGSSSSYGPMGSADSSGFGGGASSSPLMTTGQKSSNSQLFKSTGSSSGAIPLTFNNSIAEVLAAAAAGKHKVQVGGGTVSVTSNASGGGKDSTAAKSPRPEITITPSKSALSGAGSAKGQHQAISTPSGLTLSTINKLTAAASSSGGKKGNTAISTPSGLTIQKRTVVNNPSPSLTITNTSSSLGSSTLVNPLTDMTKLLQSQTPVLPPHIAAQQTSKSAGGNSAGKVMSKPPVANLRPVQISGGTPSTSGQAGSSKSISASDLSTVSKANAALASSLLASQTVTLPANKKSLTTVLDRLSGLGASPSGVATGAAAVQANCSTSSLLASLAASVSASVSSQQAAAANLPSSVGTSSSVSNLVQQLQAPPIISTPSRAPARQTTALGAAVPAVANSIPAGNLMAAAVPQMAAQGGIPLLVPTSMPLIQYGTPTVAASGNAGVATIDPTSSLLPILNPTMMRDQNNVAAAFVASMSTFTQQQLLEIVQQQQQLMLQQQQQQQQQRVRGPPPLRNMSRKQD